MTGTNWGAGEAVHLFVNDDEGKTWSYSTDVTADSNGGFTNQFQLPTSFVALYSVTATGASGAVATASFTDGNVTAASLDIRTNASPCVTSSTSFNLGDTVCAHSNPTTITGNGIGDYFIQWVNPGASVVSTVTHSNATTSSAFDDTLVVNATGVWTVKACSNNPCSSLLQAKTFTVTGNTAAISGTVYQDSNGNGSLDAGEPGISGVSVSLSGTSSGTTTTNGSGLTPSRASLDTLNVSTTSARLEVV